MKHLANYTIYLQNPNFDSDRYLTYFFEHMIHMLMSYSYKMISRDVNNEYKDRDDYIYLF